MGRICLALVVLLAVALLDDARALIVFGLLIANLAALAWFVIGGRG